MDPAREILRQYEEGLYTLGETHWRLAKLIEEPDQVPSLIAQLPREFAAAWVAWARSSYGSGDGSFVFDERRPLSIAEKTSINALRTWLLNNRNGEIGR